MRSLKIFAVLPLVGILASCATSGANYVPVVDNPGPNYGNDLAQCQALARQQGTVDNTTLGAAATGAALSGGAAALIDNTGNNARDAALIGAAIGATGSAINNTQNQEAIVRNCLRGRGYKVAG